LFEPTLLFATIFSLTSAGIYFYVGHSLSRRRVISSEARLAWALFVVWWYALAVTSVLGGMLNLLGAMGLNSVPLFLTFTQINLLAICAALYGLIYYLVYLFTGNRKVLVPLTMAYIVYYALLMYYVNLSMPISVSVGRWSAALQYEHQPTGPFVTLILVLLVFPQIIGSLAYFTLFFRVKEATQKYRVALVSWSIIIWFLSAFIASIAGLSQYDWWQILSRLIGLGATLTILMAYQPINWIKNRLGVTAITEGND
jgi:hypothetical protein